MTIYKCRVKTMKKTKIIIIILCMAMLFSGCGRIVTITNDNKSVKTISSFDNVGDLFDEWSPVEFSGGESFRYAFEINTGTYVVNGTLDFSVSGKAPNGLRFAWKFTVGTEVFSGGYFGKSTKFYNKFNDFCGENPITTLIFNALVAPYEAAGMYNTVVANFDKFEVGNDLKTTYKGKKYCHVIKSKDTFGDIDGFTITTSLDEVPINVICISPYTPFPTYALFFSDSDGNSDFYVMCNLEAAILP